MGFYLPFVTTRTSFGAMAMGFPANQAIVVGGGLAGMSAANQVVECGGKVLLVDKSSFCGGNSTKATSGINGAATKTQKTKGIDDSIELFTSDTLKGGAKRPDVAKVLCGNSGADVDWPVEKFDLDPPFRLCLNKAASEEIHWHCKHYTGRGVMKYYESGADLAKDMGVSLQTLVDTHDGHYEAAKKTEKDPDGGSWPAYPSGKSWDA